MTTALESPGPVVCIGECMIEFAPEPGTGGRSYRRGVAGDTYNTAVYLARLHPAPVSYLSALGTDTISDEMISRFRAEGLETGLVGRIDGAMPGLYVIETDGAGERRFHYWRNNSAARRMLAETGVEELAERLARFRAIYFSGITLAILPPDARDTLFTAIGGMRTRPGAPLIAFDPNFRTVLWPDTAAAATAFQRAASLSDVVLSTWDDDRILFGDADIAAAAARWRATGVRSVMVRNGGAGCLVTGDGADDILVPAEAGTRPVDTTGCGDSFNAGFLAARLAGKMPADAARFAHRIAARVSQYPGAIIERKTWDQLFPEYRAEVVNR